MSTRHLSIMTHALFAQDHPRQEARIQPMEREGRSTGLIAGGAAVGLLSVLWAPLWLAAPLTLLGVVLLVVWLGRVS